MAVEGQARNTGQLSPGELARARNAGRGTRRNKKKCELLASYR